MIKQVIVHTFSMGDVEDPEIFVAEPLYEWEHSEAGAWIMQHSVEIPSWRIGIGSRGYTCTVRAVLNEEDYTFWRLKYE